MKLFIDSADVDEIARCWGTGLISGVTTNPTLLRQANNEEKLEDTYQRILDLGVPDLSMEVTGSYDEMMSQPLSSTLHRLS